MKQITPDLIRKRLLFEANDKIYITHDGRKLINFSSNDYLNLRQHPQIVSAYSISAHKHGFGTGSSAIICGASRLHGYLEAKFAEFFGFEKALLFNSAYMANLGIITALADRSSKIYADKLCHASLIDGIVLSRAKLQRYRHNDMTHLNSMITRVKANDLIVTEGVFSMQGDRTCMSELIKITQQNKLSLLLDDSHGVGVLGKDGRGTLEAEQVKATDITGLIVSLGKAFGGFGGIVCGSTVLINYLVQTARTYRYTTAMPLAILDGLLSALHIMQTENWRQQKLEHCIEFFNAEASKRQLNLMSTALTPIKAILLGDNNHAEQLKNYLLQRGFLVAAIRPNTVPIGTARIRISLNAQHSESSITQLLDYIADYVATI